MIMRARAGGQQSPHLPGRAEDPAPAQVIDCIDRKPQEPRSPRCIRAQQDHSDAAALHQRPGRRQRVEIDCQNARRI